MSVVEQFREFLGEEQFHKFVALVRHSGPESRLYFWQEEALDKFERTTTICLPRSPVGLDELLKGAIPEPPPPPQLGPSGVPEWIVIDRIDGYDIFVQSEGVCHIGGPGPWRFYFRFKYGEWTIGACDDESDPVDVGENSEHTFFHEEVYEGWPNDSMPTNTARFYIVRELARLRAERGSAPPQ